MDFWINSLKVVSIVAAGIFGTLGLLTKYKDGDKITRWGRLALGGIILSAALSLTLQLLQTSKESARQRDDAIRSAKEARQAEEAARGTSNQLKAILETARTTSDQQTKNLEQAQVITSQMDNSLKAQAQVLSGNKKILGGVVEGARRDTKNTVGILRTIWDESNRVEANQITIAITYTFLHEPVKQPPPLLESEESLSLAAVSQDGGRFLAVPLNRWSSKHLLDGKELLLKAREHRVTYRKHFTVDGAGYQQISYFSAFEGDIRRFFDMTTWNGAFVEVLLTKQDPALVDQLKASLHWRPEHKDDVDDLRRHYDVPQDLEENDYHITPLPVLARLTVYVRERPIATSEAVLVRAWEHDEDVRGLIVAKFPIAKVPENTFPQFKPTL